MANYKDINEVISDYICGTASDEERQMLELRMSSDEAFHEKMKGMMEGEDLTKVWEIWSGIDDEKALSSLRNKILGQQSEARVVDIQDSKKTFWYKAVAAAVLLLVASGTMFWYRDYTKVTPPESPDHPDGELIVNGSEYVDSTSTETTCMAFKSTVKEQDLEAFNLDAETAKQMLQAENISTYYNKEYWVTLDDGTKVHLNGNSRIIYPERFAKASLWNPHPLREVVLEGEAYFMVAHDKSRRFVVHTSHGDIIDYGTEFYVSAPSSGATKPFSVALIKGKVGVKTSTISEKMLNPGEEALMDGEALSVQNVDTEPFIAWNTGTYAFEGSTLENLMDVICRWYDMDISFEDETLKAKKFDGVISRYESLDNMLRSISTVMNLKIRHDNSIIMISK